MTVILDMCFWFEVGQVGLFCLFVGWGFVPAWLCLIPTFPSPSPTFPLPSFPAPFPSPTTPPCGSQPQAPHQPAKPTPLLPCPSHLLCLLVTAPLTAPLPPRSSLSLQTLTVMCVCVLAVCDNRQCDCVCVCVTPYKCVWKCVCVCVAFDSVCVVVMCV